MKIETIEEFLARGGKITKVPPKEALQAATPTINQTTGGPANLLSYGEADLFYGEARTRKTKKAKVAPKIDFSALPEALRKKYMKELTGDEE